MAEFIGKKELNIKSKKRQKVIQLSHKICEQLSHK